MTTKPSLFDPFFSSIRDVVWKSGTKPLSSFQVITQNIPDEANSLARQFATGVPGWHAALITLTGFSTVAWASPSKAGLLEGIIRNLLPPIHNGVLLVLPGGRFLLLLQHIQGESLTRIATAFVHQIAPDSPPTSLTPFNLESPNNAFHTLCTQLANPDPLPVSAPAPTLSLKQQTTFALGAEQRRIRQGRTMFRALIIEDDPATALLLSQLVSGSGQISTAHNAVQAVALYKDLVPNLVFLDIGLPDVDGLTLAQRITMADPQAFVVMITANAFKSNLDASLKAGAKGFIAKPFNREHIQRYLAQARMQTYA